MDLFRKLFIYNNEDVIEEDGKMGFFRKLFGADNDNGTETKEIQITESAQPGMLRTTSKGGLDKRGTLTLIDSMTAEIMLLQEAAEARNRGEEYQVPPEKQYSLPDAVSRGGFNEEDVKGYMDSLQAKINNLRAGL